MANQFIGRRVNLGVSKETARGVVEAGNPDFWIPRTTLTFDDKAGRHIEEESLGVIDDADRAFVTERWGEGEVSGEIRHNSFGLFLYNLLGTNAAALVGGEAAVYDNTFTISQTNNHQSLTFCINDPISSDAGEGDTRFPLVMIDSLTINIEVGKVVTYTANFMSRPGDKWARATATYTVEQKLRATDLTFKMASARTDLAAASAIPIKSLSFTINKNLLRSMVLGSIEPDDIFNQQIGAEGTIVLDYEDKAKRNIYLADTYQAMLIQLVNQGTTIGVASFPSLTITLPRTFITEWNTDRTLNDISTQTFSFKALRDVANAEALIYSIVLRNAQNSY